MKTILVACSTERDYRELERVAPLHDCRIVYHHYDDCAIERIICKGIGAIAVDLDPSKVIQNLVALCKQEQVQGILSTEDYPGSIFASIIGRELGYPCPSVESVLTCQHKYQSRFVQRRHVHEAVPDFCLFDVVNVQKNNFNMQFPVFLKPIKSFFSIFAHHAHSFEQLTKLAQESLVPEAFLQQFNWFLQRYTNAVVNPYELLVEEVLSGLQVTVDGYVFQGEVEILGVVDSIMFPGTICFERFVYPSGLPEIVQNRMAAIAKRCMRGMNFDNGLFNIEMMYNSVTDSIHIIEINPRMASQFADLYEKVDGVSLYSVALAIAQGEKPWWLKKQGQWRKAASFVLRIFEDKIVQELPSHYQLEEFYNEFPDARVQLYAKKGAKLSDLVQDGKSFRYGLIHLGGTDIQDLMARYERAKRLLVFQFK